MGELLDRIDSPGDLKKLSEEELIELMIHVAHYAGWASGANGQAAAVSVFKDLAESSN